MPLGNVAQYVLLCNQTLEFTEPGLQWQFTISEESINQATQATNIACIQRQTNYYIPPARSADRDA